MKLDRLVEITDQFGIIDARCNIYFDKTAFNKQLNWAYNCADMCEDHMVLIYNHAGDTVGYIWLRGTEYYDITIWRRASAISVQRALKYAESIRKKFAA